MKSPVSVLSAVCTALLLIAGTVVMTQGCSSVPDQPLQTGDLVFASIPADEDTTYMLPIHTAIVEVDKDGVWIIDATAKRGVARRTVDEFVTDYQRHDGSYPEFSVYRLEDNSGAAEFISNEKQFLGEEYDIEFLMDNGKHYCTELVYDSYIRNGEHLFELVPISFADGQGDINPFWTRIFGSLGVTVPSGQPGTTPEQMLLSPSLHYVDVIVPEE